MEQFDGYDDKYDPKNWARNRQRLKFDKRRDCRKSEPNGGTMRAARRSNVNNQTEIKDSMDSDSFRHYWQTQHPKVIHLPNPIETHFNEWNCKASKIQSHLYDIIEKTNPNEIVFNKNNPNTIEIIYKYTKEQNENLQIWQRKFYKKLQKQLKDKDMNWLYNPKNNQNKLNSNGSDYIAPTINEPKLQGCKHLTFRTNESTPKDPKCEFILIDFGSNRWITGFSTTFAWYKKDKRYLNSEYGKKQNEWCLNAVGNYSITIGCDNNELENNLSKFFICKKKTNNDSNNNDNNNDTNNENIKTKQMKNKNKNRKNFQNNERNNNNNRSKYKQKNGESGLITEGQLYLDKLNKNNNITWECLGKFNGMLDGFYVNYKKEFEIEKQYVLSDCGVTGNSNQQSNIKYGKLCRYIKIVPTSKSCNFGFSAYGKRVNLLGKPVATNVIAIPTKDINNEKIGNDDINNSKQISTQSNNTIASIDEKYDSIRDILTINGRSKILEENNMLGKSFGGNNKDDGNEEHIVKISFEIRNNVAEEKYSCRKENWEWQSRWNLVNSYRENSLNETRMYLKKLQNTCSSWSSNSTVHNVIESA